MKPTKTSLPQKPSISEFSQVQKKPKQRITDEQKKFRMLSYLSQNEKPILLTELINKITKNSQRIREEGYLTTLVVEKLVEKTTLKGETRSRYTITEKGKQLIYLLKLVNTLNPNNPILSLDLFTMTESEKKLNNDSDFEKIFEFRKLNNNEVKEWKEKLGF